MNSGFVEIISERPSPQAVEVFLDSARLASTSASGIGLPTAWPWAKSTPSSVINSRVASFLDILSNSFELHHLGDLRNGRDHGLGDAIVGDVADKAAVNLQRVDFEVLQVGEGTQTGTEVVKRDTAAALTQ